MATKRSILIYSGHCEIMGGGDAKYLFDIVNHIDSDQFDILIYTDRNAAFEERAKTSLRRPISVTYLNTRPKVPEKVFFDQIFGFLKGKKLYRYGRALYRALTLERPREALWNSWVFYKLLKKYRDSIDIFHFNNGGYPAKEAGLIALMVAHRLGIKKIIMSFHNMPVRRRWFRPSDYLFDSLVSRACHEVIAASETLKTSLIEGRRFPKEKVTTIYCGLEDRLPLTPDEAMSYRTQLGIGPDVPVAIICGNLDEDRKGHAFLFRALSHVKVAFPKILLLVVGQGNTDRMAHFSWIAKSLGIEENVRFLGYRTDIHELNGIADVVVVPSTGLEATPYTIKEAARAARPVITTSAGGCAEAVIHQSTGLIVEPNNEMALYEALMTLLGDAPLRHSMGQAGRGLFLQKFLLQEKVSRHEEIYKLAS